MKQAESLMIHKEHTDELDLKQVANDFVSSSEHRCHISSFTWSFFLQQGCVVGWVWLWPYHFKGACSGPATHGGPVNLACVGRCACVSTHFLFVNEGQRS